MAPPAEARSGTQRRFSMVRALARLGPLGLTILLLLDWLDRAAGEAEACAYGELGPFDFDTVRSMRAMSYLQPSHRPRGRR